MPESAVVRCPACSHLVAVPEEYFGKVVTCLQCHAVMEVPVRELMKQQPVRLVRPGRRKVAPFVFVPMFGLLLLGGAGVLVNSYLWYSMSRDEEVAKSFVRFLVLQQIKESPEPLERRRDADGKLIPPTEAEVAEAEARQRDFVQDQEKRIAETVAVTAPYAAPAQIPFIFVSLGVFLGGVAFAARRWYPLAFIGCGLALLNINHACCVPGAIVGIWGVIALISEDGRRHFNKTVAGA